MSDKVYICGNGILTNPGDAKDWNRRAAIWIEEHAKPARAQPYLYFQDIIFRRLFQQKRVDELIAIVKSFEEDEFDIYLVGHSNFCDIICRLLQKWDGMISEVHLIAGACEANCEKNGINAALKQGRLAKAFIYVSADDSALKSAKLSETILGWAGLGYGSMGLTGPVNRAIRTRVIRRDSYDHSTWFDDDHFDETMRLITNQVL